MNNNNNTTEPPSSNLFQLPDSVEKAIDTFLGKVERHEFSAGDGYSAQLQCALEAVDLYQDAFNKLNDDPEEYWAVLVAVNSRLQSAPALRILFGNLGKRVAKHLVEAVRSREIIIQQQQQQQQLQQQQAAAAAAAANNNHNNNSMTSTATSNFEFLRPLVARANTTTFNTSVSMLQMDEYYDQDELQQQLLQGQNNNNNNVHAAGVFGVAMMSPSTFANGGGQFPNMCRVPTTAILDDHDDVPANGGNGNNNNGNGTNNNNGNGNNNNNNNYGYGPGAYGLENLALMTPAAVGTTVNRPIRRHVQANTGAVNPSAFKKIGGVATTIANAAAPNTNNTMSSQLHPHGNSSGMTNQSSINTGNTNNTNNTANNNNNNNNNTRIKRRKFISVTGARQAVEDSLNDLKGDIESTTQRVSSEANHHIQQGESVLAFGCTHTLTSFFRAAAANVRFKVFLIETANGSGSSSLEGENYMSVERIPMSSCYAIMSRVSKVFVSTEAVFANGGLVAFSGTHAVCLAAKVCNVPVIVVVASIKFSDAFPSDSAGTTLIKVDQNQGRSVEWRDFLPPGDILPQELGSASDAFDCLFDTDSSDEGESESSSDEDEDEDDDDEDDAESESDQDESENDSDKNTKLHSDPNNLSDTLLNQTANNNNKKNRKSTTANANSHQQNQISSQNLGLLSPRSLRQARKAAFKKHRPPVQVWNPLNEYVPPEYVSIFVTELHEITPALVQVFVESLNEPKLE